MSAAWMLYCVALGMLLLGAGVLAERIVHDRGGPTRRVWAWGLTGTLLLPLVSLVAKDGPPDVIFKSMGVVPEHRKIGLLPAILVETIERGHTLWNTWFAALIRSDNRSRRPTEGIFRTARRYVLYRRALG